MSEPHPGEDRDPITPEEIARYLAWPMHPESDGSRSRTPYLDSLRFDQKFLTENGISPK